MAHRRDSTSPQSEGEADKDGGTLSEPCLVDKDGGTLSEEPNAKKACTQCKVAKYCDTECQVVDWDCLIVAVSLLQG